MIHKTIQAIIISALLLCTILPGYAKTNARLRLSAISVNGSLTSAVWARENKFESPQKAQTDLLLYEYFRARITNIGNAKLSAYIDGRVGWERWTAGEEHLTNRLYQGYLDWKLSHRTSLRVGRQFLPNNIGFWQMNGFRFGVKRLGADETAIYAGLTATPLSITGKNEGIVGIEEMLKIWRIRGRFSFITLFEGNGEDKPFLGIERMSRAILGSQFDLFSGGLLDVLQPRRQWLYMSASGNIDLLAKQFISGYVFTGVRLPPKGELYVEYRREIPLFPEDSIFSVFAFETLQEAAIGLNYDIIRWLRIHNRYSRQLFDDGPINRYSFGFELKTERESPLVLRLERLDDIDRHYWRIYSRLSRQLMRRFEIALSNYYNMYKLTRALRTEDAYSFQLKIGYYLSRNLSALLRIEDNINPDYKYNVRVLGYLRMGFGFTQ